VTTTSASLPAARERTRARGRAEPFLWGLVGVVVLAIALQVVPALGIVNPQFFPPLDRVVVAFAGELATPAFWSALLATLYGWLLGLAIATVAGVVLGVLIAGIPIVAELLNSTIEFLRPIPSVALVPLVVLLFGISMQATLVLVVYASLWQVLIQVMYGVRAVDVVATETARSYHVASWRQVTRVIWPSILPYVFVGIRLAATVALVLEITGELVIGSPGLGKQISLAQTSGAVDTMYALIWVSALLGVVVSIGSRAAERRTMFWHPSIRGEV